MTVSLKSDINLHRTRALYYKDRSTFRTINEAWYKDGEVLRKVFNVAALPSSEAPSVLLSGFGSVKPNSTSTCTANILGGVYDTVSYHWTVTSGGGSISGEGSTAVYTAPSGASSVVIRCTVTAAGTGTNTKLGTTASSSDTQSISVSTEISAASAPAVVVSTLSSVAEDSTVAVVASVSGGNYDTITYSWETVSSSGGSLDTGDITGSGALVMYSPAVGSNDRTDYLKCTVSVSGTGTNATSGTSDSASDTSSVSVIDTDLLPDPTAPTVTIGSVTSVAENETLNLTATVSGGSYDRVTYAWSISSGGGAIGATGSSVNYYPPNVSSDTAVTVSCTVTAHGDGDDYKKGATDTDTDTEQFTVLYVSTALPDADAPSVTISNVSSVAETSTLSLTTTLGTGTYDTISYAWAITSPSSTFGTITGTGSSVTYNPPNVTEDTTITVGVTVTVTGTGEDAKDGTSDTSSNSGAFVVNFVLEDAVAPSVTISSLTTLAEETSHTFTASVVGGTYDSLSYAWSASEGSITSSGVYTAPDVSANTSETVSCTVTASGDGTNAVDLSSDTDTDTETFTISYVPGDLPVASAPSISISPDIRTLDENTSQAFTVTPSGGVYDELSYTWAVPQGPGTFTVEADDEILYSGPEIDANVVTRIRCRCTATGTGKNAENKTSDLSTALEAFHLVNVADLPDADIDTLTLVSLPSPIDAINPSLYNVTAVVTGDYDSLSYSWSTSSGTISGSGSEVSYIPSGGYNITCQVTATGSGTNATSGTTDTQSTTSTSA